MDVDIASVRMADFLKMPGLLKMLTVYIRLIRIQMVGTALQVPFEGNITWMHNHSHPCLIIP